MNLNFDKKHRFESKPEKYSVIGHAIDAKLKARGISRYRFAKDIGISATYLCHIMTGRYEDSPKIPAIMKELGIKASDLEQRESA